LEILSFNWARKRSIPDERNRFWREIEREGAGFGAGGGSALDREVPHGMETEKRWGRKTSAYSQRLAGTGSIEAFGRFSLSFSLCHVITFSNVVYI
jgi:hypothetical protein